MKKNCVDFHQDQFQFGLVLWHINNFRLFDAKSSLYRYIIYMICKHKSAKLNGSKYCYISLTTQLNISYRFKHSDQIVLFQTIQFSINHLFTLNLNVSNIWPIDKTLSDATTPGQNESGSNGNESVFSILQSSRITGASPSDCLMLYPGYLSGGGSYPSAEMQSMYSTAPAD